MIDIYPPLFGPGVVSPNSLITSRPWYEVTHLNSMLLFELAIMLIICCEISFDRLEDSREIKALRESLMIRAFLIWVDST